MQKLSIMVSKTLFFFLTSIGQTQVCDLKKIESKLVQWKNLTMISTRLNNQRSNSKLSKLYLSLKKLEKKVTRKS